MDEGCWGAVRQIATNCKFSVLEDYKEAPLSRSPQHTHKSSRKPEQSVMNKEAEGIICVTAPLEHGICGKTLS